MTGPADGEKPNSKSGVVKMALSTGKEVTFEEEAPPSTDVLMPEHLRPVAAKFLDVFTAYLKAVRDLLETKYAAIAEFMPVHLREKRTVIVFLLDRFALVRFDNNPRSVIGVGHVGSGLHDLVKAASSCVLYLKDDSHPATDLNGYGVVVNLTTSPDPNQSGNTIASETLYPIISIQEDEKAIAKEPLKPFRYFSLGSTYDFTFVVQPQNRPDTLLHFRRKIPLNMGWNCVELYATQEFLHWHEGIAYTWAENEILAQNLARIALNAQFSSMDPSAGLRKEKARLIKGFKELLEKPETIEEELHQYLKSNPELISPSHDKIWSKVPFGAKTSDFVIRMPDGRYLLVEIERATHRLFNEKGYQSAPLNHAIGQINEWTRYIQDNHATVEKELGMTGISAVPDALVVIGRRATLSARNVDDLKAMRSRMPTVCVMTYDELHDLELPAKPPSR